jgi:hypothetical protein
LPELADLLLVDGAVAGEYVFFSLPDFTSVLVEDLLTVSFLLLPLSLLVSLADLVACG